MRNINASPELDSDLPHTGETIGGKYVVDGLGRKEPVEGRSLEEIISRWGRLPVPTAIDCMMQAMESVAQAHSYGIVHGHLTAGKILVTRRPDRTWCIKVDFSPRRVEPFESGAFPVPQRPDVGTDVRALGSVLHALLTGAAPTGGSVQASLPRALGEVVQRSLLAGRAGYGSVSQLARMLAPFGTDAARVSCERIECLLDDRVSDLTKPSAHPRVPVESQLDELPPSEPEKQDDDADDAPMAFVAPASGRIVGLALVMLVTLGAAALGAMYMSVHPEMSQPNAGVAEMQGR
jgi:hypothetical protein